MSNRRKPSNQRKQRQRQRGPASAPTAPAADPFKGMEPWLWAMQDADEAERRGDAAGALAAMRRRAIGPDGQIFWRPSRIHRLEQLVQLEGFVPRWAISRWILAQAHQHLADADRGPGSRAVRAVDAAVRLRGGLRTVKGSSEVDRQAQVMDHDWVFRQLQLFDLGGLDAFLSDGASPDLVAGSERIDEWAQAPMGGYYLLSVHGDELRWMDVASGQLVRTPNIGTAVSFSPGCDVIGRLVPVEDGVMFESTPLAVTAKVAREVAADPARWLAVLTDSGTVAAGEVRTDVCEWTGLLSDVPLSLTTLVLSYRPDEHRVVPSLHPTERARATLELARSTLNEEDREAECACGDTESCDDCFDDGWDGWAHVHAALVDPGISEALADLAGPDDLQLVSTVHERVAEPARSLLGRLLEQKRDAA